MDESKIQSPNSSHKKCLVLSLKESNDSVKNIERYQLSLKSDKYINQVTKESILNTLRLKTSGNENFHNDKRNELKVKCTKCRQKSNQTDKTCSSPSIVFYY